MPKQKNPLEEFLSELGVTEEQSILVEKDISDNVRGDVSANVKEINRDLPKRLDEVLKTSSEKAQISPKGAQEMVKDMIEEQTREDALLRTVFGVRRRKVEIMSMAKGDKDESYYIKVRDPKTGEELDQLRAKLGDPKREGEDIFNETVQTARFYQVAELSGYKLKPFFGIDQPSHNNSTI